jgi:hypothetical protein
VFIFGLVAEWWPRWGQRWGREHRRATPRECKYPPAAWICHEISWLIGSLGTKQLPTAFRHSIKATPEEESVYADLAKLREIVKDTATKDHLLEYGLYKRFLSSSEALASTITKIRDRVAGATPGSPSLPLLNHLVETTAILSISGSSRYQLLKRQLQDIGWDGSLRSLRILVFTESTVTQKALAEALASDFQLGYFAKFEKQPKPVLATIHGGLHRRPRSRDLRTRLGVGTVNGSHWQSLAAGGGQSVGTPLIHM